VLISQCGTELSLIDGTNAGLAVSMAKLCQMNVKDLMEFLGPHRLHVKQK
jgi:hypothetical protein